MNDGYVPMTTQQAEELSAQAARLNRIFDELRKAGLRYGNHARLVETSHNRWEAWCPSHEPEWYGSSPQDAVDTAAQKAREEVIRKRADLFVQADKLDFALERLKGIDRP